MGYKIIVNNLLAMLWWCLDVTVGNDTLLLCCLTAVSCPRHMDMVLPSIIKTVTIHIPMHGILTFTTLNPVGKDNKLMIYFLFFPENRLWHFMQIVSWEKNFKLSSAEIFTLHAKCFFFFLIWVLRPFQEYFTYIEPIVHRRWAKTGEPGEKPPDHL